MKIVAFADPHVCHKNPASRTDNYEEAAFAKLEQIGGLARSVNASAVVCSGDFFHLKTGTPHHIVIRLLAWARRLHEEGILVIGIAGNHDLVANRLASLDHQPLGVLFASGYVQDAGSGTVLVQSDVTEAKTVGVFGLPYPVAVDPANLAIVPPHGCDYGLLLIHAFTGPESGEYFGEVVHANSALAAIGYDVVVCGHDHRDQGVTQVGLTWVVNVGALLRGNIKHGDVDRDVKVAVVTFAETVTVQQVKLRVAKGTDIFDVEAYEARKAESSRVEEFLTQLEADLNGRESTPLADRLLSLNLPETVRVRVRLYLDAAEQQT